jgi:phosphate transport system substrate-binding protein
MVTGGLVYSLAVFLGIAQIESGSGEPLKLRGRMCALGKGRQNLSIALFGLLLIFGSIGIFSFRHSLLRPSEHVVLSIQGSTTLGDELMPKLAEAFLREEMRATKTGIRTSGKDARGHSRLYVWGTIPGRSGRQVIEIYPSESSTAFQCLADPSGQRKCDIGMASRPINAHDQDMYPVLRNLGGRLSEHVAALDAIAVIVNPKNPVSELSISQLQAIYSGQITNWKDVGGADAPIEFFGRDSASGTFEMFTEKVFGKDARASAGSPAVPQERQIADSSLIVDAVMHSKNAIGYVSLPMVRHAKAIAISDGSGPALLPTAPAL